MPQKLPQIYTVIKFICIGKVEKDKVQTIGIYFWWSRVGGLRLPKCFGSYRTHANIYINMCIYHVLYHVRACFIYIFLSISVDTETEIDWERERERKKERAVETEGERKDYEIFCLYSKHRRYSDKKGERERNRKRVRNELINK